MIYESLSMFKAHRSVGHDAEEMVYGEHWRDHLARPWRVVFVPASGDVYAVVHGTPSVSRLGGVAVQFSGPDDTGIVELLSTEVKPDRMAAAMSGWEEVCGTAESLAWVRGALVKELRER